MNVNYFEVALCNSLLGQLAGVKENISCKVLDICHKTLWACSNWKLNWRQIIFCFMYWPPFTEHRTDEPICSCEPLPELFSVIMSSASTTSSCWWGNL